MLTGEWGVALGAYVLPLLLDILTAILVLIIMQRNVLEGHWRCHRGREKTSDLFFLAPLGVFINN